MYLRMVDTQRYVRNLVRVTLADRFRGEEESVASAMVSIRDATHFGVRYDVWRYFAAIGTCGSCSEECG